MKDRREHHLLHGLEASPLCVRRLLNAVEELRGLKPDEIESPGLSGHVDNHSRRGGLIEVLVDQVKNGVGEAVDYVDTAEEEHREEYRRILDFAIGKKRQAIEEHSDEMEIGDEERERHRRSASGEHEGTERHLEERSLPR